MGVAFLLVVVQLRFRVNSWLRSSKNMNKDNTFGVES